MVLSAVNEMHRHVTADQIYTFIRDKYPSIGRGTVYRNLGILVEEGKVRKVEVPDGSDRFDFTLENHYHVECVKCGEIFDVDMDVISEIEKKIKDAHGMKYISHDIFFKGINRGFHNCVTEDEELHTNTCPVECGVRKSITITM